MQIAVVAVDQRAVLLPPASPASGESFLIPAPPRAWLLQSPAPLAAVRHSSAVDSSAPPEILCLTHSRFFSRPLVPVPHLPTSAAPQHGC